MADPDFNDQKRGDLAATGLVYDSAMGSSNESHLANNLRGTETAKGLLGPDQKFESGLGGDRALSEAIQNKYSRIQGGRDQQFKHEQKNMASQMHFEKLQHASEMVNQEQNMNFQKALEKKRRDKAAKAARGALVGQVLGIVGAAVAGYFTGGAGAAAGYAAGNAAGSAIGGGE